MKQTGWCLECTSIITRVTLEVDGVQSAVQINSKPDPNGRLYVDRWDDGRPVLFAMPSHDDIPPHVPTSYSLHAETCKGKQ